MPNIPIQVKNAMPFLEFNVCYYKKPKCTSTIFPVEGLFKHSLILKNLFENVKSTI